MGPISLHLEFEHFGKDHHLSYRLQSKYLAEENCEPNNLTNGALTEKIISGGVWSVTSMSKVLDEVLPDSSVTERFTPDTPKISGFIVPVLQLDLLDQHGWKT